MRIERPYPLAVSVKFDPALSIIQLLIFHWLLLLLWMAFIRLFFVRLLFLDH